MRVYSIYRYDKLSDEGLNGLCGVEVWATTWGLLEKTRLKTVNNRLLRAKNDVTKRRNPRQWEQ